MNEPIVEVIAGVLLSLSAGVRMTLPLLVVNLLAFGGEIVLPHDMAWLGSGPTLVVLGVAAVAILKNGISLAHGPTEVADMLTGVLLILALTASIVPKILSKRPARVQTVPSTPQPSPTS